MHPNQEKPCLAILGQTDPALRTAIARLCIPRRFRAGETVQHEFGAARFVGFVVEGVLRLVKYRPDGSKHIIGLLFEDAMFGRLFDRMPPLSVEAATDATICSFERHAFETLLMRHSELEHRIFLAVCDELDAAHEGMLILSSARKEERLATFLLQLWRHAHSRRVPGGSEAVVELPVNRTDVARYLGTSPETVSRILSRLARQNVLRVLGRREIEILDRERLVELSGWDAEDWMDLLPAGSCPRIAAGRAPRALPWSVPRRAREARRKVPA